MVTHWTDAITETFDLAGPRLAICMPVAQRNVASWSARAAAHDCRILPHVKGHKVEELLRYQLGFSAGVEVAKMTEILAWVDRGVEARFILAWAWLKPGTWDAVARLNAEGVEVWADVDSVALVDGYAAAARRHNTVIGLRVQVNTGLRGAAPSEVPSLLAAVEQTQGVRLAALTAYRSLYSLNPVRASDEDGIGRDHRPARLLGRIEAQSLVSMSERYNLDVDITCGSTPTLWGAAEVDGVTDLAAGAYALSDWTQAQMGTCDVSEIALVAVAKVASVEANMVTVDIGANEIGFDMPYPGVIEQVRASTPDGSITFTEVNASEMTGSVRTGSPPKVGDVLAVHPAQHGRAVGRSGQVAIVDAAGNVIDVTALVHTDVDGSEDVV